MKKFSLVIAAMAFILVSCNSGGSNNTAGSSQKNEEAAGMANGHEHGKDQHAMLGVQGNCEMCKERIEKAAKDVKGVTSATWDIDKKELHLNFDPHQTDLGAISKAIAKAGHDTDKDKADQAVYQALPDCCKYRQ